MEEQTGFVDWWRQVRRGSRRGEMRLDGAETKSLKDTLESWV